MSDFMTGFLDKQLTQLDEHIASLQRELEEARVKLPCGHHQCRLKILVDFGPKMNYNGFVSWI